jgi:hypothetical protein
MEDADSTPSLDERVESVLGILGSATEEPLEGFGQELKQWWEAKAAPEAAAKAAGPTADQAEEVRAFQARLEAEKRAAEEEAQRQAAELQQRNRADRTEARGREAILNKYGFDDGGSVDEDGNVMASASGVGGGADAELGAMLGNNANKSAGAEAAKQLREAAKQQHAKKVLREKELLAKQREKKEAEKKRTQKREKQRGCG